MTILRSWIRGWPGALLGLIIAIFVVYPLVELVAETLAGESSGGGFFGYYDEAFASPIAFSAIWGTFWLTSLTLIFGLPLGVLLAWITSSTDAPLGRSLAILPTLSLALSPLVGAIGWLVLLAPRVGMLNLLVRNVFGLDIEVGPFNAYSLPVIVMLMVFYVVPYIYGPTFAAFSQVDASLQEAARICGAGNRWILLTVTLPILRPAVLAGALIGGVMAAAMFAIPLILSSGTGLHVIPTQVYHYINQEGRTGPAMAMASLLSVLTISAMVMYFRILGRGRFVTVSGKGSRRVRVRLGRWRWLATGMVLLFLFVSLVVPLCSLIYLSLVGFWSSNVFAQPISFNQYRQLVGFPFAIDG
ncbi:MAG: ABC transporter permease subunit, partial [Alphaproteobacteria bacterium]